MFASFGCPPLQGPRAVIGHEIGAADVGAVVAERQGIDAGSCVALADMGSVGCMRAAVPVVQDAS